MVLHQEHNITVQITRYFNKLNFQTDRLTKLVKTVCSRFNLKKAAINIAIVNDSEMKNLNKKFLNRNNATDCLSFDLSDDPGLFAKRTGIKQQKKNIPKRRRSDEKIIELVVNGERASKEAKRRGHSGQAEMALYVLHGLLHNLGFDDSTQSKAKKMHETEDQILQELEYGSVYNKDTRA